MAAPLSSGETVEVTCPVCQVTQYVPKDTAGQPVSCCNCDSPLPLPQAATPARPARLPNLPPLPNLPAVPAAAVALSQPAPTQIVVNVAAPAAPSGLIQKQVSGVVVGLLWWFLCGAQYIYMGQVGKGLLAMAVFFTLWSIMIFTCFITAPLILLLLIPLQFLCLIDTILVFNRLKKGPISAWRCF